MHNRNHEHPIGEMPEVMHGLFVRTHASWFLRHHANIGVLAVFSCVNGFISIGLIALLAFVTRSPFVFPSLGPTAFLFFYMPSARQSSPRNTIIGHLIGVVVGYLSLVVAGLTTAGPAISQGVTGPRVVATALSLGLTAGLMILLKAPHPPAGSTAMIISLGIMTQPWQLGLIMIAVLLLTAQAFVINRVAGIPYPLWSAPRQVPEGEYQP